MTHTAFIIDRSDLARYRAVMKRLHMNVAAPKQFLMAAGEILMTEVEQAFRMERDPNTGEPWRDLEKSTKAGRKKGRKKTNKVGPLGIKRASVSRHSFATGVFKSGKRKGQSWSQGYKILQDSGRLRASFVRAYSMVPAAVAVGSDLHYAPYHQFGVPYQMTMRRMLPEGLTTRTRAKLMRALIAQVRAGSPGRYMGG